MIPVHLCSPEAVILDRAVQRTDAEVQQHGQGEHDGRVAEGEEVPDAKRALPVLDQLAGGVVDRGDVVGVKGMAHAQGVGQHPGADPKSSVLLMW